MVTGFYAKGFSKNESQMLRGSNTFNYLTINDAKYRVFVLSTVVTEKLKRMDGKGAPGGEPVA